MYVYTMALIEIQVVKIKQMNFIGVIEDVKGDKNENE